MLTPTSAALTFTSVITKAGIGSIAVNSDCSFTSLTGLVGRPSQEGTKMSDKAQLTLIVIGVTWMSVIITSWYWPAGFVP